MGYPQYATELNSDSITTDIPKQVEVYPYPSESVTMRYTCWATPKMLNYNDYLPPAIDPDIDMGAEDLTFVLRGQGWQPPLVWAPDY